MTDTPSDSSAVYAQFTRKARSVESRLETVAPRAVAIRVKGRRSFEETIVELLNQVLRDI